MIKYYKLVDKVPVECSLDEYATSYDRDSRVVGKTSLPNGGFVSTVFLALDHSWSNDGIPILFETMYFPTENFREEDMVRYPTWDEAYEGHRVMVEKHGGSISPKDFFDDDLFEL